MCGVPASNAQVRALSAISVSAVVAVVPCGILCVVKRFAASATRIVSVYNMTVGMLFARAPLGIQHMSFWLCSWVLSCG